MRYDPIIFTFVRFLLIGLALGFLSYFIFNQSSVACV